MALCDTWNAEDTWKPRLDAVGLQFLHQLGVDFWNILKRDEVLFDPPLYELRLGKPLGKERLHLKVTGTP